MQVELEFGAAGVERGHADGWSLASAVRLQGYHCRSGARELSWRAVWIAQILPLLVPS